MTDFTRGSRNSRTAALIVILLIGLLAIVPSALYPENAVDVQAPVSSADAVRENADEAGVPEEPDNPIDAFFDYYVLDNSTSSNADMTRYREARADAWLAEVEHGYAMLKELINPHMSDEGRKAHLEIIDRARESFLIFAEDGTYIQSTVTASNVFEVNPYNENIFAGSAAGGYHLWLMGDMYRNEALRLHDMIRIVYHYEETPELFVFDAEEFMAGVTENYGIVLTPAQK